MDIPQDAFRPGFFPASLVLAYEEHLRGGARIHFIKGEYLFREGDIPQGLYYLERGEIKLTTKGGNRLEPINKIIKAGEIIGFNALLKLKKYTYSALAHKDSTLIFISKKDFKEILDNNDKGNIECNYTPFFNYLRLCQLKLTNSPIMQLFKFDRNQFNTKFL